MTYIDEPEEAEEVKRLLEAKFHTVNECGPCLVTVNTTPKSMMLTSEVLSEVGWVPVMIDPDSSASEVRERLVMWAPVTEVIR